MALVLTIRKPSLMTSCDKCHQHRRSKIGSFRQTSLLVTKVQPKVSAVKHAFETYDGGVPGALGELVQRPNHRVADFFAQMDDFVWGHPNAKVCSKRVRGGVEQGDVESLGLLDGQGGAAISP
jgi:hypothetical protein